MNGASLVRTSCLSSCLETAARAAAKTWGLQPLAKAPVLDPDDRRLGDTRLCRQHVFELGGEDVLAAETIMSSFRPSTNSRPASSTWPNVSGAHWVFTSPYQAPRRERECRFDLPARLAGGRFGGRSLAETLTL